MNLQFKETPYVKYTITEPATSIWRDLKLKRAREEELASQPVGTAAQPETFTLSAVASAQVEQPMSQITNSILASFPEPVAPVKYEEPVARLPLLNIEQYIKEENATQQPTTDLNLEGLSPEDKAKIIALIEQKEASEKILKQQRDESLKEERREMQLKGSVVLNKLLPQLQELGVADETIEGFARYLAVVSGSSDSAVNAVNTIIKAQASVTQTMNEQRAHDASKLEEAFQRELKYRKVLSDQEAEISRLKQQPQHFTSQARVPLVAPAAATNDLKRLDNFKKYKHMSGSADSLTEMFPKAAFNYTPKRG